MHIRTVNTAMDLHEACDAFVTFLYAAAVHLVFHAAHVEHLTTTPAAILLFVLIIFFFSDWLSRVRLPWLIRDPIRVHWQLLKTGLELIGLAALLSACLIYLEGTERLPNASTSFICYVVVFLCATSSWNLVMFRVMEGVKWRDLFKGTVLGTATDLHAAQQYAKSFVALQEHLASEIHSNPSKIPSLLETMRAKVILATLQLLPQVVALHLSIGNPLLAFAVMVQFFLKPPSSLLGYFLSRCVSWPSVGSTLGWLLGFRSLWLVGVIIIFVAIVVGWFAASLSSQRNPPIRTPRRSFWLGFASMIAFLGILASVDIYFNEGELMKSMSLLIAFSIVPASLLSSEKKPIKLLGRISLRPIKLLGGISLLMGYLLVLVCLSLNELALLIFIQQVGVNIFLQYAASPLAGQPANEGSFTPSS